MGKSFSKGESVSREAKQAEKNRRNLRGKRRIVIERPAQTNEKKKNDASDYTY